MMCMAKCFFCKSKGGTHFKVEFQLLNATCKTPLLCRKNRQCSSPFSMSSGGCSQEKKVYLGFSVCCRQQTAMGAALQHEASRRQQAVLHQQSSCSVTVLQG